MRKNRIERGVVRRGRVERGVRGKEELSSEER